MTNSKKHKFIENGETSDLEGVDEYESDESQGSSSQPVGDGVTYGVSGDVDGVDLSERLTDILIDQGDGDSLATRNYGENRLLQWFQPMDLHVTGACRTDERLKPLLKLNVSSAAAEDRLLSHLNQNFEVSEVGILIRCLCIPLVSIRVGKIMKQGPVLRPTSIRGNLNVILLPTSDLRISFIGDDGSSERLVTLHSLTQRCAVRIERISADASGRSFLLKVTDTQTLYFWCSEYSKLLGNELLSKMRGVLERTPSLAELTGICEARLKCFAMHLRAYLKSTSPSPDTSLDVVRNIPTVSNNSLSVQNYSGESIPTNAKQSEPSAKNSGEKSHIRIPLLLESRPVATAVGGLVGASSPYYCWCPPKYSVIPPSRMMSLSSCEAPVSNPFKPLMCESIVHVPVMDVCSSGQAYLVSSAGSGPGLGPGVRQETVEEKGARETLRLLLSSSSNQATSSLQGVFVTGGRGVYEGSPDAASATRMCGMPEQVESGNDGELGLGNETGGGEKMEPACSESDRGGGSIF